MLIEFMLHSIKDRSIFYGEDSEKVESIIQISDVAKKYTRDVLNNVINDLFTNHKIDYKGSYDCITQEAYRKF